MIGSIKMGSTILLLATVLCGARVDDPEGKPACFYDFDKTLANGTLFEEIEKSGKGVLDIWNWIPGHIPLPDVPGLSELIAARIASEGKLQLAEGIIDHLRKNKENGVKNYIMTYGKVSDLRVFLSSYPKKYTNGEDLNALFDGIYGTQEGQNIKSLTDDSVPVEKVTFGIADYIHAHVGYTKAGWGYMTGYLADKIVGFPSWNKGPYHPNDDGRGDPKQKVGWAKWQRILYIMRRENISRAVFCDDDEWNCNAANDGGFGYSTDKYYHDATDGTDSLKEQERLGKQIVVVNVPSCNDGKWFKQVEDTVDQWMNPGKTVLSSTINTQTSGALAELSAVLQRQRRRLRSKIKSVLDK